jgi:hypothetical protein
MTSEILKYKGKGISDLVSEEIRDYMISVAGTIEDGLIEQAGILYHISNEAMYLDWGYKNLEEYANQELDMKIRTAQRMIQVWNYYVVQVGGIDLLTRMVDEKIGISKLVSMVDVINSENADEWIKKAKEMNRPQLEATCAQIKRPQGEGDSSSDSEKKISGLKTFQVKLFEDQREIIEEAIEKAKEISENSSKPALLSFIAQDFVATNLFKTGDAPRAQLMAYFRKFESILTQFKFTVTDRNTGEVIYGGSDKVEDNE